MTHCKQNYFSADDNSVDLIITSINSKTTESALTIARSLFSPLYNCSPITGLSLGFEDLTTLSARVQQSPRRKLSLSSFGNTPISCQNKQNTSDKASFHKLQTPTSERLICTPRRKLAYQSVLRFQSLPVPRNELIEEGSQDSGIDTERSHVLFSLEDIESNGEDSQESGIDLDKDCASSDLAWNIDNDLEVSKLLEKPISSRKLLSKRSQSFDVRSRDFSYREKEPDVDEPVRKIKRRNMFSDPSFTHIYSTDDIELALIRSDEQENLVGDFSRCYLLPLVKGRHHDLKCISSSTLASVLAGKYCGQLEKCIIVDCRYPYEYESGHIQGAVNVYTRELLKEMLLPENFAKPMKRVVIVFHCEFSSERGPTLARFLREEDRKINKDCYPSLFYPEIYVLEGGYKSFYEQHKGLCEPQGYKPMNHEDHLADLRHFHAKSRSWACERSTVKRLPFTLSQGQGLTNISQSQGHRLGKESL